MSPAETPDPESDYFLEIESHFAARRGTPFVFSGKDWALMKSWQKDGVPLAVVLEAIDSCFVKREALGRKRTISSLSYCRHAVRELWDERKDLQVGAGAVVPELEPGTLMEALATELDASAARGGSPAMESAIHEAAARTRALALSRAESLPLIEERLLDIEEKLFSGLISAMSEIARAELHAEIESALGGHRLEDAVAARTREANLRRLLRARYGIPRLSLLG